jgi:hypothetical protein
MTDILDTAAENASRVLRWVTEPDLQEIVDSLARTATTWAKRRESEESTDDAQTAFEIEVTLLQLARLRLAFQAQLETLDESIASIECSELRSPELLRQYDERAL